MSDILEEIQELSNKFSNLFEVDDLGQPAMDVPPSQNKIKRDRKTKDGKVELVSVEDELFPYEGNKREQYRQKILDTINNMIQGKATLEDLLQIVRQKKAPLKEAMEVLEELIKEGRNLEDVVVRSYDKGKVSLDDLQKLMDKAHEIPSDSSYFHKSKGEKGELRTKHRHMDYERNVLSDGWGKDDNKKIEASIKRKAKNDKSFPVFQALKAYKEGKADIKEALEIMEDIWSKIQEQPSDKKEELTRMYYKMKQKEGKTTSDIIDDRKKHMTKQEKGQEKTKERNQKAWKNYLDAVRDYTENTPSMYQFEALEKALSLTEEIINEVSVGALARAVENNLPKRKKNEEVAIKAYKQAQNEYEKGSKESPEDEPALYKKLQCTDKAACKEFDKARDAENLKDLNLPKDSKVSANKLFNAAKKVNPERQKKTEETVKNTKGTKEDAKKFLNSLKRDNRSFDISLADPVKSRADEALEEALSLMEAIINELDYKFVSKQKASADKTLAKKVKAAEDEEEGKNKEAALDDVAKYKHKMNTTMDHVEQKRMNEIKTEEAKKNK